ncbi:MAG: hypothetical protein Q9181_006445 [Wetmoreana brouardii]
MSSDIYAPTCVNFLSTVPPVAIPSSASSFLSSLLEEASREPSADSIRPIYRILSGAGSYLLDALPPKVIARMQAKFKNMLQGREAKDISTMHLLCVAVLALMSSLTPTPRLERVHSSFPTLGSETMPGRSANYHSARQWERASKTLDMAVIKAISASSVTCPLSAPEIIENLHLSNTMIKAVDVGVRASWMANDRSKVKKLIEKVSAHDPQSEVLYALSLDEASIQEQLLSLLSVASRDPRSSGTSSEGYVAIVITESLTRSIENSALLRQKILYLLSTDALAAPLRLFLHPNQNASPNDVDHDHTDTCPHFVAEKQTILRQGICTLFLKTSIFAQQDELGLDANTGSALLDLHSRLKVATPSCQRYTKHGRPASLASISLFQTGSTPEAIAGSAQWRARIKDDLARNAENHYHTIVRTMGQVCEDLERRCSDVERPLRDEQTKSEQLRTALEESRLRIEELRSHSHEQSLIMEGVDNEKTELTAQLRDLEHEREELSNQVIGLRQEISEATRRAEDATESSKIKAKGLELTHAAAIAEQHEALEVHHRKELALMARIEHLEDDATKKRAEEYAVSEELASLKAVVSEQRIALGEAHAIDHEKEGRLNRQQEMIDRLEADKNGLQIEIGHLADTCQNLGGDLADRNATIDSQSSELNRLRYSYETEKSAQNSKLIELRQSSDERIEQLQTLLSQHTEDAAEVAREHHAKLRHLEHKLIKSRKELEAREDELKEAQELQKQVMSLWGKQRRRNTRAEKQSTASISSQSDSMDNTLPHNGLTAITSRGTPPKSKRSKTDRPRNSSRHAEKTAGPSTRMRTSLKSSKAVPDRNVLGELAAGAPMGLNRSSTRGRGYDTPPKQTANEDGCKENIDSEMVEASFYDTDVFASTDQQLVADMHEKAPQAMSEDTTVEF